MEWGQHFYRARETAARSINAERISCSGPLRRRSGLLPAAAHLASGDASVTIRPLILILAQRVSQNMSRDGCFRQKASSGDRMSD